MNSSKLSRGALKVVGAIPARMDSKRLPGKVLRPICGLPMVHRVFERAKACRYLAELLVATDSPEVQGYCDRNQIPVLMTADTHQSGTERIYEVMQSRPAEVYLNIQGDEPMLSASHLDLLVEPFLRDEENQVTTLKTPLGAEEAQNPNVVKVATSRAGQALYFSRAAIPYHRDPSSTLPYYKHLGLYGYRREALERYRQLLPSPLEQAERLEQLRFLENGIPIYVSETALDTIGVDTEEDWQAVTRYFEGLRQ